MAPYVYIYIYVYILDTLARKYLYRDDVKAMEDTVWVHGPL